MTEKPKLKKTVYILGAGFSNPAGGPDQSRLMKLIFDLPELNPQTKSAKKAFRSFLVEVMRLDPMTMSAFSLEDIYTPIDRCLADNVPFRGQTVEQLQRLRSQMEYLVSLAIDKSFDAKNKKDALAGSYIEEFARHLARLASIRATKAKTESLASAKAYDPFSIISLNWDMALDNALFEALNVNDAYEERDYAPIGVVDYCCYISSLKKHAPRIQSGLWTLGAQGYNVKLLKIHGSMNWLQCSNCQRLFVDFNEKKTIPNFLQPGECRHCFRHHIKARLQGSLVMPTFLKDLSNFQIKLIWQNAGVELMEADKLVFVGYSLPHADFEFKQLLARMVRDDAELEVVLYHSNKAASKRSYEQEVDRYKQFFGTRKITSRGDGVEKFVRRLTAAAASPV
ncbi:MAG TPA: hypothetical protein VGO11_17535 [Chthoniobacteraceae bacterium]|jgi:NAD-dependent SIR2 family protein deacetylase|nr:hypothetical protein [Chthoniobacteraceae bacterium]